MIRLVQAEDRALRKFCQESAFGCRILTAAECYPMASFAAFWTQWDSGKICAAVSRIESDGTVCCGSLSAEQREELALFVQSLGMRSVLAPEGALPPERMRSSGAVMRFSGNAMPEDSAAEPVSSARELAGLFSRCCGTGFDFSGDDAAYVDLSHRLRHGFCRAVGVRSACGALCAAAMTVAESETEAVVGGVCTLPEYRERGLASAAVQSLCTMLKNENRNIFLFAGRERIPFYSRLGFTCCGGWEQC